MTEEWSMPTASNLREMMSTLLGVQVVVGDAGPIRPNKNAHFSIGTFVSKDESLTLLWVSDIEFAARSAGCLTGLATEVVEAEISEGVLSPSTLENAYEIANIGTRLFNDCGVPHVKITELRCLSLSDLTPEERAAVRMPRKRADYEVSIDGFGKGRVSFLAA